MKKVLIGLAVLIVVAGVGVFLFQEPLKDAAFDQLTSDMFIAGDNDAFDPGLEVGARFPGINANGNTGVVTNVAQYAGPNGLVFVANRSVDW